jgi:hypothetical protein
MRKERQIGIRVGLPAFFALEVEDVYKRAFGAHRAWPWGGDGPMRIPSVPL